MSECLTLWPESSLRILECLHTYRFLTPPQLVRLDVSAHRDSLYRMLQRFLAPRKYIAFADFGVLPRKGRLPRFYYLTKFGAELLADYLRVDLAAISYPVGGQLFCRDYFHRRAVIDFQIGLRQCVEPGAAVAFFRTYFDTRGANRNTAPEGRLQKLTKVPLENGHLIPDAIFAVHPPDGSRFLFALEVYNGRDTGRVAGQLEKHRRALEEGSISQSYGYEHAHRVLCVFETDSALQAAMARLKGDPAFAVDGMDRQFAFSTQGALQADFVRGWQFLEPGRGCIFDR